MPPKQAKRMVAAVASEETPTGTDPSSLQSPPYWENRLALWFNQAEGLQLQPETVAHILEMYPASHDFYQQLKAELI